MNKPSRWTGPVCRLILLLGALTAPGTAQIGQLEFLDSNTVIPSLVMETVAKQLPEKSNAGAAFISDAYSPNLLLKESATVSVITIWEGAGYRNALGYFTYTEDPFTIVDRQLIFPNFSLIGRGGLLKVGDTSILRDANGSPRTFSTGTRIGFFVVADGYSKEKQIKKWKAEKAKIPSEDPEKNRKASKKKGVFTTIDAINPEMAIGFSNISRHVAMISQEGVPGFLGGHRSCSWVSRISCGTTATTTSTTPYSSSSPRHLPPSTPRSWLRRPSMTRTGTASSAPRTTIPTTLSVP